jgi:type I restriction enzyme, S subunit
MEKISKNIMPSPKPGYKLTKLGWIPEEWEIFILDELCFEFINGGTPATKNEEYWRGNIPWISGADIVNHKISKIRRYISSEAARNSSTNIVLKGNLLVVTRTGVGKLTIAPFDVAISQDLTGVYPKLEKINTDFLFYHLNYSIPKLAKLNQGTSINGITRETLRKHEIISPPLPEQQKIAQILSTWDKAIETTEQLLRAKTQLKKRLINELFYEANGIKKLASSWHKEKLKNLVLKERKIRYGIVQPGKFDPNGRYLIRGKDYSDGWAAPVDFFRVSDKIEEKYKKARVRTGDLVFCIVGSVGNVQIVPAWLDGANITQTTARISLNNEIISSDYLYYYLQSNIGRKTVYKHIKTGTRPGLNIEDVEEFEISFPSIEVQLLITRLLTSIDSEIDKLEMINEKINSQKKGLIQKLLTGELRINTEQNR